jgi:hypothetical protein
MRPEEFIERYPRVWHMAEEGSWPLIEMHGLLSTTALLDLFEITGEARVALESAHRRESTTIEHPRFGTAVIRDQKPMNEITLGKCLVDMAPTEWFENLNGRVFFWLSDDRLERMLGAGAYKARAHTVLTVDTAALFQRHLDQIALSTINSGATFPAGAAPRGSSTFSRFRDFPWDARLRSHPREPAVELAVDYSVPEIARMVTDVGRRRARAAEEE